jgi:two-component system LytT family sensor kinase
MMKILAKWSAKYRLHIIVWTAFILWEVVVIGLFSGKFGHPLLYMGHYILVIWFFYLHADYALPWSLERKGFAVWRAPLVIGGQITAFILLSCIIDQVLIAASLVNDELAFSLTLSYILRTVYRALYFMGISTGYYFLATYLKEKRRANELENQHYLEIIRRQQAEEETIKAQNAFLIAQINPHFFFNTLDYLYHNVLDVSPASAEAINALAAMMRFAIDADKIGDRIQLGEEIEQVENLIYLNQIRQPLTIDLRVDERAKNIWFIPLVVLTLTENVFKHGNLRPPMQEARIHIWLTENSLCIETNNQIGQSHQARASHTGLLNTEKRLRNSYGQNVGFFYGPDGNGRFLVSVSIPLSVLNTYPAFLNS